MNTLSSKHPLSFIHLALLNTLLAILLTGCGGSDLPLRDDDGDQRRASTSSANITISQDDGSLILTKHAESALPPSNISASFSVQTETGKPVPNLTLENFELYEDGLPVSVESSLQILPDENEFIFSTLLLLDFSDSVVEISVDTLTEGAAEFVTSVFNDQGNGNSKEVALAIFDGAANILILTDGYETDPNILLDQIALLDHTDQRDTSTNLYGAIEEGITHLEERLDLNLSDIHSLSAPNRLVAGAMVLFSDGRDEAARSTKEQALRQVDSSEENISIFTIGLGDDIDRDVLVATGTDGFQHVESIDQLVSNFINVGATVDAKANSFYLLDYCSPRREGSQHILDITALFEGLSGSMQIEYSANNFTSGCELN